MLIVGAGAIGCEFASFFAELGTQITMVEMMPQMLPLEDKRLAKQFQSVYRKRGIQVLLKTKVESIVEYADDHVVAKLSDGSEITAEKILVSVGRKPNSAGIGLETAGVETDGRGYVVVNDYLETTAPGIYAIGDVNGGHAAGPRGLLRGLRGGGQLPGAPRPRKRDLRSTPSAPTPSPRWPASGLNEEQAVERGYQPVTGTYRFAALGKALAMGEDVGYVQLVADKRHRPGAGRQHDGSARHRRHPRGRAGRAERAHRQAAGRHIHAHPTIAEALMEAAHDVHGESVHIRPWNMEW